jgi:outer membrane lipoprotein-sorting protein
MRNMGHAIRSVRHLRHLLLTLIFFTSVLYAENEQPVHDAELFANLVAAHRQHTTAQGNFTWTTRRSDDLTAPAQQQNVQFYVQFPAQYHLIITKPNDAEYKIRYISDGITRWEAQQLFADDKPDIKATPVAEGEALEQQLLACLRFDGEKLAADFMLTAHKQGDNPVVVMLPRHKNMAEQLTTLTLYFSPELTVQRIVSDDPQGNRYALTVQELRFDQPLDEQLFRLAP